MIFSFLIININNNKVKIFQKLNERNYKDKIISFSFYLSHFKLISHNIFRKKKLLIF